MPTGLEYLNKKNKADEIIEQYTSLTAGAGFIPIPFVDTLTIGGLQFTMIKKLSKLYGINFKEHRVKSLQAALLGSIGTVSGLKFFPGVGTALGVVSTSVIGAASTYSLGQVFAQHFDQGGTLLDFNPDTSRAYFKEEFAKGKAYVLNKQTSKDSTTQKKIVQELLADSQIQKAELVKIQTELNEIFKHLKKKAS